MAIAFVKEVGKTSAKTAAAATSIAVPAGGIAADTQILVNFGGSVSGGVSTEPTIADSRGNTWVPVNYPESAIPFIYVWACHVTTPLQSGDTITVTHQSSLAQRTMLGRQYSGVAVAYDWFNRRTSTGTQVALSTGSLTPPAGEHLILSHLVVVGSTGDAFTADPTWANEIVASGTSGGSAASNIVEHGAHRIVTTDGVTEYDYRPVLGTARSSRVGAVSYPALPSGDTTPPISTYVSSTKTKISAVTGNESTVVTWSVNEACQAWQIREVASASTPIGSAGQLVASGGSVPAATNRTTTITNANLSVGDGTKLLKVFAQDLAGNWST